MKLYSICLLSFLILSACEISSSGSSSSNTTTTSSTTSTDTETYAALTKLILTDDPDYDYEVGSTAYYVDASSGSDDNDGSEDAPFATISYALAQASGGEVIYVADGDYGDLQFGATFYDSGKSTPIDEVFTDWVTLKAMDGQSPTLGNLELGTLHDDGGWYTIDFDQVGNSDLRLRVDGFTITDDVSISGSRYVDIRNCTISQSGDFATMTEDEKSDFMSEPGIGVYNGEYISLLYNEITSTGMGIWAMTTDFVIKGNHIHNNTHDGIQILGGSNWLIENNIIHDLDDGTADGEGTDYNMHVDGVQMYIASSAAKYAHRMDNLTFRGNLIYHVESMDVMINSTSIDGGGYSNFIWENNIFGPSGGYLFIHGAEIEDSDIFRHNTVLYTPNDQWTSDWGREFGSGFGTPDSDDYYIQTWWTSDKHSGYVYYNNILVNSIMSSPWTTIEDNGNYAYNNIYYTDDTDSTLDDDAGYKVSTLPYDAIDTDVLDVVENGNIPGYPYSGSVVIDNGYIPSDIDSYSKDFAGNTRDDSPDIGALEYY